MKSTVDALKGLYEKLGGEADQVDDVSLIPDMIDELTDVVDTVFNGANINVSGNTLVIKQGE